MLLLVPLEKEKKTSLPDFIPGVQQVMLSYFHIPGRISSGLAMKQSLVGSHGYLWVFSVFAVGRLDYSDFSECRPFWLLAHKWRLTSGLTVGITDD